MSRIHLVSLEKILIENNYGEQITLKAFREPTMPPQIVSGFLPPKEYYLNEQGLYEPKRWEIPLAFRFVSTQTVDHRAVARPFLEASGIMSTFHIGFDLSQLLGDNPSVFDSIVLLNLIRNEDIRLGRRVTASQLPSTPLLFS